MSQTITILGATGSIGSSTLSVMAENPTKFNLYAVSANSNVSRMLEICLQHKPKVAVMTDDVAAQKLSDLLKKDCLDIQILSGANALIEVATAPEVDQVMAAIVGGAGLLSTLSAIKANKKVLLANKESLVMSGELFMQELASSQAELLPIDSEHNAIFQCMPHQFKIGKSKLNGVRRILLTGSGGPFRTTPLEELPFKTPKEALLHPNWSMGAKISIDSSTMMNKGLEWIEAKWLFGIDDDKLEIVIHPQSIIHSMVEFEDGSVLAQMGSSDMRIPIAYSMGFSDRINSGAKYLDFTSLGKLEFEEPDDTRFPALSLTKQAWNLGGGATVILNAANEIAVSAFLNNKIKFTDIVNVIESSLSNISNVEITNINKVIDLDTVSRIYANEYIQGLK